MTKCTSNPQIQESSLHRTLSTLLLRRGIRQSPDFLHQSGAEVRDRNSPHSCLFDLFPFTGAVERNWRGMTVQTNPFHMEKRGKQGTRRHSTLRVSHLFKALAFLFTVANSSAAFHILGESVGFSLVKRDLFVTMSVVHSWKKIETSNFTKKKVLKAHSRKIRGTVTNMLQVTSTKCYAHTFTVILVLANKSSRTSPKGVHKGSQATKTKKALRR